jgi:hypothetical protein
MQIHAPTSSPRVGTFRLYCLVGESWSRSPYHVRPATLNDAPILLELYERHYAGYSGSFVRSLDWQRYDLAWRLADHPPLLACDETGQVRGYLLLPLYAPRHHAVEAAADDWNAALALLQYHASDVADATDIDWSLPPDSPTFYALADRLNLTSRTYRHPNEGWMALPAHLPTLFAAIAPLFEERWRAVGGEAFRLRIGDAAPILAVGQGSGALERLTVVLTPAGIRATAVRFSTCSLDRPSTGGLHPCYDPANT